MIKTYANLEEMEKESEKLISERYIIANKKIGGDGSVIVVYDINYTQLIPCDEDEKLSDALRLVECDEDLANLGFRCRNQLNLYRGYKNFSERLWVWCREYEEDNKFKANVVITSDMGNGYCSIVYKDFYLSEIMFTV